MFLGSVLTVCVRVCVCIYLCGCILTSGGTVEFDLREDWRQTFIILIKIINVQPHVNKCNRCQGRVYYKLLKLQLTDESQMHHLLANNTTNIIGDDPNSRTRQLEYVY